MDERIVIRAPKNARVMFWVSAGTTAFLAAASVLAMQWVYLALLCIFCLPYDIMLQRYAYVWRMEADTDGITCVGLNGKARRYAYSDVAQAVLTANGDQCRLKFSDGREWGFPVDSAEGKRFCAMLAAQGAGIREELSLCAEGAPPQFAVRMSRGYGILGVAFVALGLASCICAVLLTTLFSIEFWIAVGVGIFFLAAGVAISLGAFIERIEVDARENRFTAVNPLGVRREYAFCEVDSWQIRKIDSPYVHMTVAILRIRGKKRDFQIDGGNGKRFLALLKAYGIPEYDPDEGMPPVREGEWFGGRLRHPKATVIGNLAICGVFFVMGMVAVIWGIQTADGELILGGALFFLMGSGMLAAFLFAVTHIDSHPKFAKRWLGENSIRKKKD